MIPSGVNLSRVFETLNLSTQAMEDKIREQVDGGGTGENGTFTNLEMLELQQNINVWSLATNLQTNVIKTVGDAMRSTIQNVK